MKIHTFFKSIYYRACSVVGVITNLMFVKSLQLAVINYFPLPDRVWPFQGKKLQTSGLEAL